MRKIYLEHNGVEYYGYDFYREGDLDDKNDQVYFDEATLDKLKKKVSDLKDNPTFVPAKGDEICVISDCKYNLEDVRRNYKIKRGFDKGTCNVFSEGSLKKERNYGYYYVAVIPSKKTVVANNYYGNDGTSLLESARKLFPGLSKKDLIIVKDKFDWTILLRMNLPEAYIGLFNGTLKTPSVHVDNLDLNSGEELTIDTLEIVQKLCMEDSGNTYSSGWDEKLKLQLTALNGLDWRKYPGTIDVLFNGFFYRGSSVLNEMRGCQSRYPKNVRVFLKYKHDGFASKEDFNLACSFIRRVLGLEGKEFSTMREMIDGMNDKRVSFQTFIRLFDDMVRFRDKEWKDE